MMRLTRAGLAAAILSVTAFAPQKDECAANCGLKLSQGPAFTDGKLTAF